MNNLTKRILSAVVGIPLIIFPVIYGGYFFLLFALILNSICLWEYYKLFEKKLYNPKKYSAIVLFSSLLVLSYTNIGIALSISFLILIIFTTIELFVKNSQNPVNILIGITGFIYITLPLILAIEVYANEKGKLVLLGLLLIWVTDTFAYFGGKLIGKTKLTEISPNKTVEGALIGLLFAVGAALGLRALYFEEFSMTALLLLALAAGLLGQIGDIFESFLKRYAGVKDSSNFIPGHGGFLDRFDSFLFVLPVIFIIVMFLT